MISISLAAFFFMLPWQFAQFALLTQTACIFALYILEYIGSWKVLVDIFLLRLSLNLLLIET